MKKFRLSDTRDHISEEGLRNGSRLAPAKSIFVVVRGMILAKELPVALAEVPMAFNQDMKALVTRPVADPEYLLYALAARKDALATAISTSAHGTRRMETASLESLLLPLPPKVEQRRIAGVLAKLEAAVEVQDRVARTLRELKIATMAKVFREGLRREPLKPTAIGGIPSNWAVVPLGELVEVRGGKRLPKGEPFAETATAFPYIRVVDFKDQSVATTDLRYLRPAIREQIQRYTITTDDVYISIAGTTGLVGVVPDSLNGANLTENAARLVLRSQRTIHRDFLMWFLTTAEAQDQISALTMKTSQPKLALSRIASVRVPVPESMVEQIEIVTRAAALARASAVADRKLSLLRSLFTSVLHLLMAGQVRVPLGLIDGQAPARLEGKPAPEVIEEIVRRIVEAVAPEKIVLFGTVVPGSPSAKDEVGLLVVLSFQGTSLGQALRIEREVKPECPLELLVRRPEDIDRAAEYGDSFIKGILERGRLLHASSAPPRRTAPRRPVEPRTVSDDVLREITRRIVQDTAPEMIILFGSAARGEMTRDSDLDFLVVAVTAHPRETAWRIREGLRDVAVGIPKDVIVVTPEELERHKDTIGFIYRPALREGRVLYAA